MDYQWRVFGLSWARSKPGGLPVRAPFWLRAAPLFAGAVLDPQAGTHHGSGHRDVRSRPWSLAMFVLTPS